MESLGQFEQIVLTAILALDDNAYGVTIHAKVEALKKEGKEIGGYARHYYDLFCLADRPEVLAMLQSAEYGTSAVAPTLAAVSVVTLLVPLVLVAVVERVSGLGDFIYGERDRA